MSEKYLKLAKKGKGREKKNAIKRIKELIKKILNEVTKE